MATTNQCRICKRRQKSGKDGVEQLVAVPVDSDDKLFRHSDPVRLCPVCDGEALKNAQSQRT